MRREALTYCVDIPIIQLHIMILTSGKELAIQQDDLLLLVARILVITCPKVNFLLLRCVCIFKKKLITFIAAKKRHGYQLH